MINETKRVDLESQIGEYLTNYYAVSNFLGYAHLIAVLDCMKLHVLFHLKKLELQLFNKRDLSAIFCAKIRHV